MNKFLLTFLLLLSLTSYSQNEGWAICNSGANLYFKIIGSGPPVVLIGDAGHSSEYLLDLAHGLSANYRVIYFDPRSMGKSKSKWVSDSLVNFQRTVADIEGLRVVLRIPSWSVIAHGFGTNVAVAYAARYGYGVSRVILVNPAAMTNTSDLEQYDFPASLQPSDISQKFEILKQKLNNQNPNDSLARWQAIASFQAATYSFDTLNTPFVANYLTEKLNNSKISTQIKNQYQQRTAQFGNNLGNCRAAITVVLSSKRHDYWRVVRDFENSKSDTKTIGIANAHHFPWLDNPAVFYTAIRNTMGAAKNLPNLAYKQHNESEKKNHRTDRSGHQRRKRA